jgi:hypothetical protein
MNEHMVVHMARQAKRERLEVIFASGEFTADQLRKGSGTTNPIFYRNLKVLGERGTLQRKDGSGRTLVIT